MVGTPTPMRLRPQRSTSERAERLWRWAHHTVTPVRCSITATSNAGGRTSMERWAMVGATPTPMHPRPQPSMSARAEPALHSLPETTTPAPSSTTAMRNAGALTAKDSWAMEGPTPTPVRPHPQPSTSEWAERRFRCRQEVATPVSFWTTAMRNAGDGMATDSWATAGATPIKPHL